VKPGASVLADNYPLCGCGGALLVKQLGYVKPADVVTPARQTHRHLGAEGSPPRSPVTQSA
jgi:hypothetical protein